MIEKIRRSISFKTTLVVLLTTFSALLVAATSILIYEYNRFQTVRATDLQTQAEIVAKVSLSALEFNDQKAASENLKQLQVRRTILAAAIYLPNGKLFATYTKDVNDSFQFPPLTTLNTPLFNQDQVELTHKIYRDDELVGVVYILGQFGIYERLTDLFFILAIVMAGSFVLAALLALRLQKEITQPITSITDAVRQVIGSRNFSMRVKKTTDDEIGVLVESFNQMLNEIGDRTKALEALNNSLMSEMETRAKAEEALQIANESLEERIALRTAELEYAHEQLRHAQKMEAIGQLTGGIAHDFNNLLAGMVGNMEMLKFRLEQGSTGDLSRYIDAAVASMDRATALTHRLLSFSRRQTLAPKQTNVNQMITSMEDMLRRTIGPGIQLQTALAKPVWGILCDPNQLESALLNLSINARDAMPDGGTLKIVTVNGVPEQLAFSRTSAATSKDFVTISVTDNGKGMTQDVLARAFDPFFTTKPIGQGTGLGLSMVYGFVNQSGGHISISSEPNKGTTVYIYLPRNDEVAPDLEILQGMPGIPMAATQSTILLVDDEESIRVVGKELLEELGYKVLAAKDANEALEIIHSSQALDLLLTDVGLPNGLNGRQLADAALVTRPNLKVLFITGYAHTVASPDGSLGKGMDVMIKPFKLDALAEKIRTIFQRDTVG